MSNKMRFFCLIIFAIFSLNISPHKFVQQNNIPPRLQWNANKGYCGEVALISAGLYYGQYMSQYTARAIALEGRPQTSGELLLGVNAKFAANKMHLRTEVWDNSKPKSANDFLVWVKHNVAKGYPVIIGVYTNEYLFYGKTNPNAGDPIYDHIVPVIGFSSNFPMNSGYHGGDIIYFSDNGLWGNVYYRPYVFNYTCNSFKANRRQANAKNGEIYSLPDSVKNFGIAVLGVMDLNDDTLPVRVQTNVNFEKPAIKNGSNQSPTPVPLILEITVSDLKPGISYNLYKYNNVQMVPTAHFNAKAANAVKIWKIKINSGTTVKLIDKICSNETAIFRAVKETAS